MENYTKGENVEHEEVLDGSLAKILPEDHVWIRIKPGTKVKNVIGPSISAVNKSGIVLVTGSGPAVTKVVSCAELVKRRFRSLHQNTKITSRIVEEFWEPKRDDLDLDRLKVTREIPCIQIVLSKSPSEGSQEVYNNSNKHLERFLNVSNPVTKRYQRNKRYSNKSKKDQENSNRKRKGNKENKNSSNSNSPASPESKE